MRSWPLTLTCMPLSRRSIADTMTLQKSPAYSGWRR
jgi:hypothetical protein